MSDILTREQVERFDEDDCRCGLPVSPASSPEGEFVRYSDYAALRARVEELERERDEWQRKYDLIRNDPDYSQCCALREQAEQQVADLTAQCEGLERERDRMVSILRGEALVESLHYESGQSLNLFLTHPLIAAIASSIADLLDQTHAENYLELGMHDKNGHAFTLTLQRAEKPTAHELRRLAEQRIVDLTAQLAAKE